MPKKTANLTQKHGLLKRTLVWMSITILFSTLLLSNVTIEFNSKHETRLSSYVFASSQTILVPEDHAKIQWAVNNASKGDTIVVKAGTYHENVVVTNTVSIIGENKDATILDGKGTLFNVSADNVIISGFTLQNGYAGIWLWHSNNSTIRGNNMNNNDYGIKADYSSNSTISENNISNSRWFGIVLDHSGNSIFQGNNLVGNRYNLRIDGDALSDFVNNIDITNLVNGKPVYYLTNQHDLTIDSSTLPNIGYLALINSTNVTVKDLKLMSSGQGILLAHTQNSTISNLTTTNNWNGVEVKAGSNVTVIGNNANNNFDFGIKFEHSRNSIVSKNNANNNGWAGIGIFTTQNSIVNANIVANNINYGIDLVYSTNNIVTRNRVTNSIGAYSMVLYYSNFNIIYHNNFINHFIYESVKITNTWDSGLEGNYWSSYNGTDANQDGIGDTPYIMDEGNQDNHPLMGKFSAFQVTPQDEVTTISNSAISDFQYDSVKKILGFSATGENGTIGFSRIRIPKAMVNVTYTVLVNGREPLMLKVILLPNATYEYIYLTYTQSTSQATTSKFLTDLLISALFVALALTIIILKKKSKVSKEPNETGEKPVPEVLK